MNAKRFSIPLVFVLALTASSAQAQSAVELVRQGNSLYSNGQYSQAVDKYEQALVDSPDAVQPKFNKANSFYRLDDLEKAADLFKQVAAESKDMKLVAMARYNLGNCFFKQGHKQRDSDMQKALDSYQASIGGWRQVLDMEPENKNAAHNIEVARLTIKDILDQLKNQQQQDPNQSQDQNQQNQQQQSGSEDQQEKQQQQQGAQQDPNQPAEPNQPQNQDQQQPQEQQDQRRRDEVTADQILDNEQQQRKERQMLQRGGYQKVEKDW